MIYFNRYSDWWQDGQERISPFFIARCASSGDFDGGFANSSRFAVARFGRRGGALRQRWPAGQRLVQVARPPRFASSPQPGRRMRRRWNFAPRQPHPSPIDHHRRHFQVSASLSFFYYRSTYYVRFFCFTSFVFFFRLIPPPFLFFCVWLVGCGTHGFKKMSSLITLIIEEKFDVAPFFLLAAPRYDRSIKRSIHSEPFISLSLIRFMKF